MKRFLIRWGQKRLSNWFGFQAIRSRRLLSPSAFCNWQWYKVCHQCLWRGKNEKVSATSLWSPQSLESSIQRFFCEFFFICSSTIAHGPVRNWLWGLLWWFIMENITLWVFVCVHRRRNYCALKHTIFGGKNKLLQLPFKEQVKGSKKNMNQWGAHNFCLWRWLMVGRVGKEAFVKDLVPFDFLFLKLALKHLRPWPWNSARKKRLVYGNVPSCRIHGLLYILEREIKTFVIHDLKVSQSWLFLWFESTLHQ